MGLVGLAGLVHLFFYFLDLVILAGVLLSWVDVIGLRGAGWLYSPPINFVRYLSFRILRPFRNLINMIFSSLRIQPLPIDFSPILALAALNLIEGIVVGLLLRIGVG